MPSEHANRSSSSTGTRGDELAIDAEDVHVTYADGTRAVRGVDLGVRKGEFFGFLGPNGAGKSTTIKTLVTLLHPTRGTVSINGYDVTEDPQAVCESIGYMAQETSVDEELTARENVRFACRVHGVPTDRRADRVDELLELVGLEDDADVRAENFSGGMKKRLDAATVLVHRPPVVFLDEPTTGLDPEARRRFWDYLLTINDLGTTVFLTTQYLEEVDRLCDRLAVIEDGSILTTDTPESLKAAVGGEVLDLTVPDPTGREVERAKRIVAESDLLHGATLETTDEGFSVRAENAREAVSELFVTLHDAGVSVTGFDVRSPTLDDVFLRLTGQSLGDGPDSEEPTGGDSPAELEVAE